MKVSYLRNKLIEIQKEIESVNCLHFQYKEMNQRKVNNAYNMLDKIIAELKPKDEEGGMQNRKTKCK